MNLHILSPHAEGHIDGTANLALYHHLPQTPNAQSADAILVPVSSYGNFKFNESLLRIKKPIILVDFMEYFGFLPLGVTHLFGKDPLPRNMEHDSEWHRFDSWVREHPPALYFKRELFQDCTQSNVFPAEWPCMHAAWPIEGKDAFNGRPFEVFYNWGYSNASRPMMHSSIFGLMASGFIEAISNFDHVDAKIHEPQPKWIAIHSPHTHRRPFSEIQLRQAQSKCSISLPGSGVCCFRSVEAPLHTVPAILDYGKKWSYGWNHGENCIKIDVVDSAVPLMQMIREMDMHSLYVEAQATLDRYRTLNYIKNYFIPSIKQFL